MWLPDDESNFLDDCVKEKEKEKNLMKSIRSNSPPLEGGESLCEFYIDGSKQYEKLKASCLYRTVTASDDNTSSFSISCQADHNVYLGKLPNKNFASMLNKDLLSANTFTQSFLQSILSSVDSSDPVVANAWIETLLEVIDLLPKEVVKGEILNVVVNKGQMSQPVSSRLLCCKMLGKICLKFEPYVIKKEVLPVVLSLCQDLDFEVRGSMCKQLDVIAKGTGLEAIKTAILPELVELTNDEESSVRIAGIETVVQMLPLLDDDTCFQTIIPLIQKFCDNSLSSKDSSLPIVSKHLCRICCSLADIFTLDQKQWFLKFFQELARLGHPNRQNENLSIYNPMPDLLPEVDNKDRLRECRLACAFNFPAMVLFNSPENFKRDLYPTFKNLCSDSCQHVRQTMAGGFYEIAKLLNSNASLLLQELIMLLEDDSLEVLKSLIHYLPDCLKAVCYSVSIDDDENKDLVRALITCEVTTSVTSSWRLHADFLTYLSCLISCVSSETIYTQFVPLLFVKLHTARPIPCRTAAAYSLLIYLRNTPCLERRKGIINELIRELCYGRSCHKRMLFIRVCELVLELFSKVFFKVHFFKPLLHLSGDPVPNIRLRLCSVLPRLKSVIKLPKDSSLLQQLESCVKTLIADQRDRDVSYAVSQAIEQLDKIEVAEEPASTRSSCVEIALDIHDRLKEDEERHILEMEFRPKIMQENQNNFAPGFTNKGAKIPVRKSGTLPKQSKEAEDVSRSPIVRRVSSQPKSLKILKTGRRISSPALNVDLTKIASQNSPASKESTQNQDSWKSPVLRCNIPKSRPLSANVLTWPRQKRFSFIPKQSADRCPSPLPKPKQLSEQNIGKDATKADNTTCFADKKMQINNKTSKFTKENSTNSKTLPTPKEQFKKAKGTIFLPSPDALRRSVTLMNLNADSKIPTSRTKKNTKQL